MLSNILYSSFGQIPMSAKQMRDTSMIFGGIALTSLYHNPYSWIGWGAALTSLATYAVSRVKVEVKLQREEEKFVKQICDWIRACIRSPANPYTNEARDQMLVLVDNIEQNKVLSQIGDDRFRTPCVGFQNQMEHIIATRKLTNGGEFVGVIHTAMPPTPLCARPDHSKMDELLHPSIRFDQDKLTTVADRKHSLRALLSHITTKLYAAYASGGREKRKLEEQAIYADTLSLYPNTLVDVPLSCNELDPNMNGATYLFTNEHGHQVVFLIRAPQAINPQEQTNWVIGFGRLHDKEVSVRVQLVDNYLRQHQGPHFLEEFKKTCLQTFFDR